MALLNKRLGRPKGLRNFYWSRGAPHLALRRGPAAVARRVAPRNGSRLSRADALAA